MGHGTVNSKLVEGGGCLGGRVCVFSPDSKDGKFEKTEIRKKLKNIIRGACLPGEGRLPG